MHTLLEVLNLSTDYLAKKGIESPRLNAELLLAEIINCKRIDLYLSFDRPMKEYEIEKYRDSIRRRGNYEPLQYILGKIEFFGLPFKVDNTVLIPRPETEILVEEIISQKKKHVGLKILDIGTGSGIIPICLSKHINNVKVVAIDKSNEAISIAQQNAILNNADSSIEFILEDIYDSKFEDDIFDIIVSNPPYISLEEYSTLQKEIKEYEPKIALTDFLDGLSFYKHIINKAKKWLKPNGSLFFELGKDQSEFVKDYFIDEGFSNIKVIKDLQSIDRVITGDKI